jgi:predicted HD phosphohydrolase
MSDKVDFTAMEHASREDYDLVFEHERQEIQEQAARVIGWLKTMDGDSPYQISRLDHCLQTATRAQRDGADDETVVCALLHDIGDVIAPANHSQVAAAMLRPYISDKNHWVILHHGLFQGHYWMDHYDQDKNARDQYKSHPYYQDCVDFCANWDQASFDPDYDTLPLEHFVPLVKALFARTPQPCV